VSNDRDRQQQPPVDDNTEFERALQQLRNLLDAEQNDALQPMGPAAIYTATVTVWMLVFQRLQAGASLADAVTELIQTPPEFLPNKRRVCERTLSANTGSFSRARARLRPEVTEILVERVFQSLVETTSPSEAGRRVFL
jgi:hypothetical protein